MRRVAAGLGGLVLITAGMCFLLTSTTPLAVGVPAGVVFLMFGVASMSWSVA